MYAISKSIAANTTSAAVTAITSVTTYITASIHTLTTLTACATRAARAASAASCICRQLSCRYQTDTIDILHSGSYTCTASTTVTTNSTVTTNTAAITASTALAAISILTANTASYRCCDIACLNSTPACFIIRTDCYSGTAN